MQSLVICPMFHTIGNPWPTVSWTQLRFIGRSISKSPLKRQIYRGCVQQFAWNRTSLEKSYMAIRRRSVSFYFPNRLMRASPTCLDVHGPIATLIHETVLRIWLASFVNFTEHLYGNCENGSRGSTINSDWFFCRSSAGHRWRYLVATSS